MHAYEINIHSTNSIHYGKPVTTLVVAPDAVTPRTGGMLFVHGWGGNRFQHRDKMEITADARNLVCVSAEFRQSGYASDPVTGSGYDLPYDLSFMQTFDALNAFRHALSLHPQLDRRRLYAYGGSQGGHIVLLAASVFAPETFCGIYVSSAITRVPETPALSAGRVFAPWEQSARNAIEHAGRFRCPIFMEHGTADETVDFDGHALALERRLRALGRAPTVRWHEGGGHDLQPAITKLDAYKALSPALFACPPRGDVDDFVAGRRVSAECAGRALTIDWEKPVGAADLFGLAGQNLGDPWSCP
jgi:predicted esterase